MNLDDFLKSVLKSHHLIQSSEASKVAAKYKREASDINLSPQLTLSGGYLDDQKPTLIAPPSIFINRTTGWNYSAALAKSFSSGTQAALSMNLVQTNISTSGLGNSGFATGALSFSLAQSLWKDFFGTATRLKQERERKQEEFTRESYNLQINQILIEAEANFWELLYMQEEQKLRSDSLQRSKKIESWVKNRFGNGIGDKSDVLNAQGLVAARELQLLQSQDDLVAMRKKVSDLIELREDEAFPLIEGQLAQTRPLEHLVLAQDRKGRRVRMDSYLSVLEAKTKAIGALEAAEAVKPDLILSGGYSTNSFDSVNGVTGAYNNVYSTNLPTVNVGLKLIWLLDSDLKNASREASRSEALASTLKMERQLLESESAWQELVRRHRELTREVEAANLVAEVQKKKASAEREKLEKGRSITLQVVTAEQDAAESELNLVRMQAAQRKMESQARMFMVFEEHQ